jgi:transcription initiation factor TFIIB
MDCYSAPIDTHNAAAEEAALPRRMPSAPEASSSGLGLQRMRGYVTLSLRTPDQEPAAVSLSLNNTPPPEEDPATAAAAAAAAVHERVQPRGGEKAMSEAYRAIADMAARLGIAAGARDRAVEVFLRMEERKGKAHHYYTKGAGRSGDALYAACLYVACRRAGAPRTFKELAAAVESGLRRTSSWSCILRAASCTARTSSSPIPSSEPKRST